MSETGTCMKLLNPPDAPDGCELPSGYKAKRCFFCKSWTTDKAPWDQRNTPLDAWHPLMPWGRGNKQKPIGDVCKVCMVVWEQCGFEAEHKFDMNAFRKAVTENGTLLHPFLACRLKAIKIKIADPSVRFRLEKQGITMHTVVTQEVGERGLEAPEEYWVELSAYEKDPENPPVQASDYVYEYVDGVLKAGVNVLTGKAGWHKRINRDYNSVSKRTKLTDDVEISDGAIDKVHAAAKSIVLKRKAATIALPEGQRASSSSRAEHPVESMSSPSLRADNATERGDPDDATSASDDETDMPSTGLMNLLKGYQNHGSKAPGPKAVAKSTAAKAAAPKKASVRPKACPKASTSSSAAMKTSIGSVDSKRRKTTAVPEFSAPHVGNTEDMCAADKEIVESFQTRLQDLRSVKPPLSEPQFKTYIGDLISKSNSFWSDVRTKSRSAKRRNNKDDPLPMVLDGIEESIKEHINLLKCVLGTAPVDSTTTLITMLDEATTLRQCDFNNAVIRKGLKSLVIQDVHVSDWQKLSTDTLTIIHDRFGPDAGDGVSSDDFFIILVTQNFQKLLRCASSKFKNKETTFGAVNKEAFEGVINFLSVMATGSQLPDRLKIDAEQVRLIMTADTAEIAEVSKAALVIDGIKRSQEQIKAYPLAFSLLSLPIGLRFVKDAKEVIEERKEKIGDAAVLQESVETLQGLHLGDTTALLVMSKQLKKLNSIVLQVSNNKVMMKSIGADTVKSRLDIVRSYSLDALVFFTQHQVMPWVTKATAALMDVGVLPDARVIGTWEVAQELGCLELYQPLGKLLTAIYDVGHQLGEMKAKNSTDAGKLHQCIHTSLVEKRELFQDSVLNVAPNAVKVPENDFEIKLIKKSLCELFDAMVAAELKMVKACMATHMDAVKVFAVAYLTGSDGEMDFDAAFTDAEQASLRLACLPNDDPDRAVGLAAMQFLSKLFTQGQTKSKFTELDETHKLVDRLLSVAQRLKSNIDLLRSTGSVSWSAIWQFLKLNDAVDIVDVESRLSHETEKLKADYAQLLKKQEEALWALCEQANTMNPPDAMALVYDKSPDVTPKMDDIPQVSQLNDKHLAKVTAEMQSLFEVTDECRKMLTDDESDAAKKLQITTHKAQSIYHNLVSLMAVIALLKIFSCRRWAKAMTAGNKPPAKLIKELKKTMLTARELGLNVPANLQAAASKHSSAIDES